MTLLTNIVKYNPTNYLLKFNTNDNIYYRISLENDDIKLILEISNKVFLNDIEYYECENSINFIINNKIATYYKIDVYETPFTGCFSIVYFKNISPEILLQLT